MRWFVRRARFRADRDSRRGRARASALARRLTRPPRAAASAGCEAWTSWWRALARSVRRSPACWPVQDTASSWSIRCRPTPPASPPACWRRPSSACSMRWRPATMNSSAGARDLWPELAAEFGLPLARDGALAIGTEAEARAWTDRLTALGAEAQLLAPGAASAIVAGLPDGAWAAFTPEDWRLDRRPRWRGCGGRRGARRTLRRRPCDRLRGRQGRRRRRARPVGRPPGDRHGRRPELAALAPELATLTPIKGHILRAEGAFGAQPVVRAGGVYLCAAAGEAVLGATMETGVADAAVDPAVARRLLEAAASAGGPARRPGSLEGGRRRAGRDGGRTAAGGVRRRRRT